MTERASLMGLQLYKGQLHSHTSLSDGIGLPNEAFTFVKQNTTLDFYAITEHEVTFENSVGNDYIESYTDAYSEGYKILHDQANAHNQDHEFVAIAGIEITWYDKSGHMNIYNTAWFPRSHGKGANNNSWVTGGNMMYDLPTVYARIAQDPDAIAQFNHPSATRIGNFFDFKHYNKEIDHNLSLFEYRFSPNYPNMFQDFVLALDKGWHVSPVYSRDEHRGNWGNEDPYATGLWAKELTREGIYEALRNRHTYSSADRNFELAFTANGYLMGSILPVETDEIDIHIVLKDPDQADLIDKVLIYTNEGQIVKEYIDIHSNEFRMEDTLPCTEGDYFFIRVFQTDGDEIISAPVWIGDVTRGTEFAPEIVIHGEIPKMMQLGAELVVPKATATDNRDETLDVKVDVFNVKGEVTLSENCTNIEEYGAYYVRYSATDSAGNTRVELKRILVDCSKLDEAKVLNEFDPIVNIGEKEDEVGVNLVADPALKEAFVQYKLTSNKSWEDARCVSTTTTYFEGVYGTATAESHLRILASHKATLSKLQAGKVYDYRFGLSPNGPWGSAHTFETADLSDATVMYILGDLEPTSEVNEIKSFNQMLEVLKTKRNDGRVMVQLGNFVANASKIHSWRNRFEHAINQWNLITAHIIGESEVYTKKKYVGTFTGFFNLPQNGSGCKLDLNYAFDYGAVHVAVISTLINLDEQLTWLENDLQATQKQWKVIMGHHSFASEMDKIVDVMQRLGVHLYIGGHDRIYKRTSKRDQTLITAGTTGPAFADEEDINDQPGFVYEKKLQTGILLHADEDVLTVDTYNVRGEKIDQFILKSLDEGTANDL